MALADVERLQIIAHSEIKMELLSSLQEEGYVQLEEADCEEYELASFSPDAGDLEHSIYRIKNALDYFSRWEEKGFFKKIVSQKPQVRLQKRWEILEFDFHTLLDKLEELEARKNELLSEIKFLEKESSFLSLLEQMSLPIASVAPTERAEIALGTLPRSRLEDFQELAEKEAIWFEVINQGKRLAFLLVFYLKKEKDEIEQSLKDLNFSHIFFTEPILRMAKPEDGVRNVLEKISDEIEVRRKEIESLDNAAQELSVNREKLMAVYDILVNEKEKILCSRLLGRTENVFYVEGWIRSADVEKLKSRLKPFSGEIQMYFRPPFPGEEPPSVLENPRLGKPFEVITKLYGYPQRGSFDPTMPLAPFFFIFVGLCVGEAGYGLLVTLFSLLFIRFVRPRGGLLQFLKLMAILGISNVIFGTLLGGWFGFPVRKLMIIDPLVDPLSFLMLSLVLGFVQVWFGTLLKLIDGIRNKRLLQSIFVEGGWLLLLPSLVLYFVAKQSLWGISALVGAAGIVFFASPSRNPLARFFGGLYSLYDISRYVADILSYSRLLALGLATTVIAMVVNTLSQTALGIPWLGWLVAALIFVGGHLFNLGISFLGGFVHSMRLQFVEFFSKFYRAGGRPFQPFEMENKYVEFI